MRPVLIAALLFLMLSMIALPAQAGFRSLANEISMNEDLDRVWIPFLGIGRVFVKVAHPEGIHDLRLAVFEKRHPSIQIDLESLVDRHVDLDAWSPMVRARSRTEDSHIFIQERGENIGLLVASSDGDEVVVIELELDAERFAEEMEGDGDFISLGRGERATRE